MALPDATQKTLPLPYVKGEALAPPLGDPAVGGAVRELYDADAVLLPLSLTSGG